MIFKDRIFHKKTAYQIQNLICGFQLFQKRRSQQFVDLMRMEAADFCNHFFRWIAADHFDLHITAGYISALPDLRLIDQLIVRKEDGSIFPGIFDDGIDLLFVFCALILP
jgi:hypothetical protein